VIRSYRLKLFPFKRFSKAKLGDTLKLNVQIFSLKAECSGDIPREISWCINPIVKWRKGKGDQPYWPVTMKRNIWQIIMHQFYQFVCMSGFNDKQEPQRLLAGANNVCDVFILLRIKVETRWGGGHSTKFYYGEAPPRGPTPYPFMYHFWQKRYPFCIPSIEKWYPFHIPT